MIKFVTKLNEESIVDVEGVAVVPPKPVKGTSHLVSGILEYSFLLRSTMVASILTLIEKSPNKKTLYIFVAG
jgi:hypothetical protein